MKNDDLKIEFRFNKQKAIETILYFSNAKKNICIMNLLKFIFYSDLYHLNKYERPVLGDIYYAMKKGPVASQVYDMLKESCDDYKIINKEYKSIVIPQRDANCDYFSDTDLEVFETVLENFKNLSADELSKESHKTLAWKNAWKNKSFFAGRSEMKYEDFLENFNPKLISELREYGKLMVF